MAVAALDRGWTLYAHTPPRGAALKDLHDPVRHRVWEALRHIARSPDLPRRPAAKEITIDEGTARFGGFGNAEYGATDEQLQADIAQLLVTTTDVYGAEPAVARGGRGVRQGRGPDGVATTDQIRHATRIRKSVIDVGTVIPPRATR